MPENGRNHTRRSRARSAVEESREKMLQQATYHIESVGASMGMPDDVLRGVIDNAGVTKAEFFQIWPTTEAFLAELFCELANQAQVDRADTGTLLSTWRYLSMRIDDLRSAEGRRRVLEDVIRTAADYNFEAVTSSNKWRTYAALSATIMSWSDEDARERILEALRASEFAFVDTMETFYRNVLPTIGYRLKPAFGDDYQPFVVAAASVIEGLGIVRSTVPSLVEAHFDLGGDSAGGGGSWSAASLAFIGVVDAFIEPDPEFTPEVAIARLSTGMDVTAQ
ncbi:MAG: hypothetical protein ABI255_11390 [Microbacteriaceae bacterium]